MSRRTGSIAAAALLALACASGSTTTTSSEVPTAEEASHPAATPEVLRGERLLIEGRASEARAVFQQAVADDEDDARAWLDLGLAHEQMGDVAQAESAYGRAIQIDPRFAEAHNNLGVLLRERGALAEATASLERAVALDPELVAARFNLGLAYEEQGRLEDAELAYRLTIDRLPGDPVPRINLAFLYLDMGRTEDAASQLRAARPAVADDVLLLIAVGEGLRRAGAPEEAVELLERALAQADDAPPTSLLAELALAYYAMDDLDAAERTMALAISQDEIDPALHYAYGSIVAKQGRVGEARRHLQRAIRLDPDGPYADRARRRLEALK